MYYLFGVHAQVSCLHHFNWCFFGSCFCRFLMPTWLQLVSQNWRKSMKIGAKSYSHLGFIFGSVLNRFVFDCSIHEASMLIKNMLVLWFTPFSDKTDFRIYVRSNMARYLLPKINEKTKCWFQKRHHKIYQFWDRFLIEFCVFLGIPLEPC